MTINTVMMKKKLWDMILFTAMTLGCGGVMRMLEDARIWYMRLLKRTQTKECAA